jgi:50S ribosomal subunit-associated GTPase HflX
LALLVKILTMEGKREECQVQRVKLDYQKPRLIEYGSVERLSRAGGTGGIEGLGGMMPLICL